MSISQYNVIYVSGSVWPAEAGQPTMAVTITFTVIPSGYILNADSIILMMG